MTVQIMCKYCTVERGGRIFFSRSKKMTVQIKMCKRTVRWSAVVGFFGAAHSKPPNVVTRWGTNPNVGNLEWGSESEFLTELLR